MDQSIREEGIVLTERHKNEILDLETVCQLLFDCKANEIMFGQLLESQINIIIFLPNIVMPQTKEYVKSLAKLNYKGLKENYVCLKLIVFCKTEVTFPFAKECQFPIENIFTDPQLQLFKKMDLGKSNKDQEEKMKKSVSQQSLTTEVKTFFQGIFNKISKGNQGDPLQQGGFFIIGNDCQLRYSHQYKFISDHLDISKIEGLVDFFSKAIEIKQQQQAKE